MTDRSRGSTARVPAIDVVRGFVMVVMTIDHSSGAFNATRSMADGAATFQPDTVFEPLQFLARWVTHLCAPTFVFLAGVSLALSVTRRQRDGIESSVIDRRSRIAGGGDPDGFAGGAGALPRGIDRDILIRGALLIGLDVAWMSWMWRLGQPLQLGVLYAIGVSMIGLIALRRLPALVVGGLGVAVMAGGEAMTALLDPTSAVAAATMTGGQVGSIYFLYPFLPWSGFLMVGWAVGIHLAIRGMRSRDWLALAAVAAVAFAVVRGANGYGNAGLLRRDGSWMEWLHVSKYPPSLAFAGLELGIACAMFALIWRWKRPWQPLVVLGQTALVFYLIHAHLLKATALALGMYRTHGLGTTAIGWLAALVVMFPACRWYLAVKRGHPGSVLRFL